VDRAERIRRHGRVDRAWLAPQQSLPPVPGGTGTGGVAAVVGGTPRSGRIDHGWGELPGTRPPRGC